MPNAANPRRSIPHIPFEIAKIIADELDLNTARNLALSSKALRDIGEIGIWRILDITTPIAEPFDRHNLTAYHAAAAEIDSKIKHALAALEAYPFRLQCVSEVRVQPSDGGAYNRRARALMKLLAPLNSQITRLDIIPRPYSSMLRGEDISELGNQEFVSTMSLAGPSAYARITHLKYSCSFRAERPIDTWMSQMVNLEELEFNFSDGTYSIFADDIDHKPLPHLRRITLDCVDPNVNTTICEILAMLIGLAPNLEVLRLRGMIRPQSNNSALQAMEKAKSLKTIIVASPRSLLMGELPPIGVQFEKFGRVDLGIREAAVEIDLMEGGELHIENIKLPRAPLLERVTLLTSPRPSLDDYISLSIGPTPSETRALPGSFLKRLLRTERLTNIMLHHLESPFPSPYQSHFVEPTYFAPPDQWAKGGYRGLIIRQFRRPGLDGDDDYLWHIRALSRQVENSAGVGFIGARRCWQDFTSYRGRRVPRGVLEEVYAAVGLEMEFLEGARDLRLPEKGWDRLDWWRVPLGGGRDEEGAFDESREESDDVDSEDGYDFYDTGGQYMMGPHLNSDGEYEDDDGVFDMDEYDGHEPYWGYDTYDGEEADPY